MEEIRIFNNESFGEVRVAGTSEQPLFCLADVCKVLELDPSQVMKRLDDGVVTIHPITDNLGRIQQANFVNEDGLYDVILESRKPQAKAFRKWITSEVVPSIRKHGAYLTSDTIAKIIENPETIIMLATRLKDEKQRRMEAEQEKERLYLENRTQAVQIERDAPRVLFSKAVETSSSSCLIRELAKILRQNGVNMGQNKLFAWLRKNGYLCSCGESYNQPTQKAMELGLFELKRTTITKPDGNVITTTTTKVTGKGQVYFINKLLGRGYDAKAS